MSKNLIPIIEANNQYSKKFDKGDLSASPKKNIAILTCMDARFDPARALGLEEGDAQVIRLSLINISEPTRLRHFSYGVFCL